MHAVPTLWTSSSADRQPLRWRRLPIRTSSDGFVASMMNSFAGGNGVTKYGYRTFMWGQFIDEAIADIQQLVYTSPLAEPQVPAPETPEASSETPSEE